MRTPATVAAASALLLSGAKGPEKAGAVEPAAASRAEAFDMSVFDFSTRTLDGRPTELSAWRGKVLLIVNTASECGYTPQYEGLEKLHEKYRGKGLEVLGFPSNDFGGQEPGTHEQIAAFCKTKYGVRFPMFEKVVTRGDAASPLYRFLAAKHGEPKWNFHKYLVGKDGQVVQAYPSKVDPLSKELLAAIDAELAK